MGFMDKLSGGAGAEEWQKKAAEMADSVPDLAAGQSQAEQAAFQQKATRLNEAGVDTPAKIKSVKATGEGAGEVAGMDTGMEYEFDLEVKPPGGDAYAATIKQLVLEANKDHYSKGAEVNVKVDPDDPQSLMLF